MIKNDELYTVVPISMDLDWPTKESVIGEILERYENFGLKRFALTCPSGGFRSIGYPSKERYLAFAELFKEIKNELSVYKEIELSWWVTLTIKNGGDFTRIIKSNGEEHQFASCPLDPAFIKRFSEDIAMFAAIAKPAFIITEDDYSILASDDCFCKHHLEEFSRRMGKTYTREEIKENLHARDEAGIAFTKKWRELRRDSLVNLAKAIRTELDKESPEIPIGYMQSGYALADGDVTEPIARAFSGDKHRPFVRFHGTGYGNFDPRKIPYLMYSPLFEKQRLADDFIFLHESDTFPHTRFFRSGKQMGALMSNIFSLGFDGSIFICNQILDDSGEEKTYAKMYKKEEKRFTTASKIAKQCEIRGVQLSMDSFYNTLVPYDGSNYPYWAYSVGRFGIPVSTKEEPVAFWDVNNGRYSDDETVKKYLSKTIFLDCLAANELCKRGYGKYLGVSVGEPVLDIHKRLRFDLGAREVIREPYSELSEGKNMPSTHMYSPDGMGFELDIKVTDVDCKVVSELVSYDKKVVIPAMTYFENELGGKVIVFGMSITSANKSQALYNYRRQRLIQHFIATASDEYVIVKNEPDIVVVQNESKNEKEAGFTAMLTLTNLCDDDLADISLILPTKYRNKNYLKMNLQGEFEPIELKITDDGITLCEEFSGLETKYILIK